MPRRALLTISLTLMVVLSACTTTSQPATRFTVQETDFAYSPVSIIVSVNQPVALVLNNTGAVEHDFVIEQISLVDVTISASGGHDMGGHGMQNLDYDLHVPTLPGKSSTVQFTPTQAGTYEFYCTVEGHKEAGMIGRIIVNE